MPERTSAQPMARRVRPRMGRITERVCPPLSARNAKHLLRCVVPLRDVRGDCWAHPRAQPLRAARCGASLRLSKFAPGEFVEPKRVRPHLSLRQIRKTPLSGRFAYLAEREGFEPSIRCLARYSLSRGAPSATRASLRVFPHCCGAGKDTDRRGRGKVLIQWSCSAGSPGVLPASFSPLIR